MRDLGVKERKQTDAAAAARLTAALLQHFEDAGARPHGLFTASMPASMETSDSSNHSLDCGQFTPDPKHRAAMLKTAQKEEWIKSENKEMTDLWKRVALTKVLCSSLPRGTRVLGSCFHYKIKRKPDMTVDKYKVRLVLQGQHMKQGVDFEQSFSPVPHAWSFRTMLSITTASDMFIEQIDISQAFVQADLIDGDQIMYMRPPPGYDEDPAYVYRLNVPLYGGKTGSRSWYLTMSRFMKSQGFVTVGFEKSLWYKEEQGRRLLVGAHVDDFALCGTDRELMAVFRRALLQRFEGTEEGDLNHYLRCVITRNSTAGTTIISQSHYAEHVLRKFNMWECKPQSTPMRPDTHLSMADCNQGFIDPDFHTKYREIVGTLAWLHAMTRPDLGWVCSSLARFVQFPGQVHMDAAMYALAHLRGTYDKCIIYTRPTVEADINRLWGWVDADYAGCPDTRKSRTGFVLMLNGGAVS